MRYKYRLLWYLIVYCGYFDCFLIMRSIITPFNTTGTEHTTQCEFYEFIHGIHGRGIWWVLGKYLRVKLTCYKKKSPVYQMSKRGTGKLGLPTFLKYPSMICTFTPHTTPSKHRQTCEFNCSCDTGIYTITQYSYIIVPFWHSDAVWCRGHNIIDNPSHIFLKLKSRKI